MSAQKNNTEEMNMYKETLKRIFVPIIALVMLLEPLLGSSAYAALSRQPYLQSVSDTQVVLRWRTTSSATSRVSYGASAGNLNTHVDKSGTRTEHEVVITGLTANTQYYYSVGPISGPIEAGNDSNHFFTTAPAVGSNRKVRIWAIGDPGTGTSDQLNVREAFYNLDNVKTDVVLTLGDNAYFSGSDSQYTEKFFNVYKDLLRQAPVWATRGNHEDSLSAYETAFTHPTNAESGGFASGTELYYSFDYGNIHFVCLDSFTSSNLNGDAMYTWLENDLASTTQKWIIAFWHHPPYSRSSSHDSNSESGQRVTRERANPILERYGVDLQLGGHNHFYSRTVLINNHYGTSGSYSQANHAVDAGDGRENSDGVYYKATNPEGAVYVLAGSSGKLNRYSINHPANYTEVEVLGSMVIDVEGDRMDVRMLRDDGVIEDFFTITKSASVNQAPQVNAGANQATDTASTINLDATVSDDGLPSNALTYSWSKISGPGTVSFGNASLVDTTASFSAAGSYVLQLEANDGALSGNDSLSVTVTAAGNPNQAPQVNAGANQATDTASTINLDATVSDDGLPSNTLAYNWSKVSGPGTVSFGNASLVDTTASFSAAGSYVLQLEVSDGTLSGNDSLSVTVTTPGSSGSFAPTHDARVSLGSPTSNYGSDTVLRVRSDGSSSHESYLQFSVTGLTGAPPSAILRLFVTDGSPDGGDVYLVGNSWDESTITGNNAPVINGSPVASTGSVTAGVVVEVDVTSAVTGNGTYSFGLRSASDNSAFYSSKEGTNPPELVIQGTGGPVANQAPQVNAGLDQSVGSGDIIDFDATVSDDGMPSNTMTYNWSKISGPGNVTFSDASLVDTSALIFTAGSYVLQLEASDSALATSDQVTITIDEEDQDFSRGRAASIDLGMLIGFLILMLLRAAPGLVSRGHR
jgi:hypothetical protein